MQGFTEDYNEAEKEYHIPLVERDIMRTFGVIMAGGGGTRFWPLSRRERPKQLLNLTGRDLMINETIDRINSVIGRNNIYIVTNTSQGKAMCEAVYGRLEDKNIILEPAARNTAACIGYAAVRIEAEFGGGIMCVFPADHYIQDEHGFSKILEAAVAEAEAEDALFTIGIEPTFPSTGYGYINYQKDSQGQAKKVKQFVEKPCLEKAEQYLKSGDYAWNSGMFVWKTSVILDEIKKYIPDMYEKLMLIKDSIGTDAEAETIEKVYPEIPKISIDYGVMEKSDKVMVFSGEFGWNDVGSWDTLEAVHTKDENGNIFIGEHVDIDTKGSVVYAGGKMVTTIGVSNLVIVETDNALLVCDKSRAQEVKKLVEQFEKNGQEEYL